MQCIHTAESCSAVRKDEALTQATTWMNTENFIKTPDTKGPYSVVALLCNVQAREIPRGRERLVVG